MDNKKRLGIALCGSYCTYEQVFREIEKLAAHYDLVPIMSDTAAETDTRFGRAYEHIRRLMELTGREVVTTIAEAEPLGPKTPMDVLVIAPCTGNTLSKLAHGLTDSAVTMAAKAHLRNGRPLVIAFSTNDGLSGSAENIAPFRQDDPEKKPNSLQADFTLIGGTVEAAMRGEQIQPILV